VPRDIQMKLRHYLAKKDGYSIIMIPSSLSSISIEIESVFNFSGLSFLFDALGISGE
jgi:hypothetical protein